MNNKSNTILSHTQTVANQCIRIEIHHYQILSELKIDRNALGTTCNSLAVLVISILSLPSGMISFGGATGLVSLPWRVDRAAAHVSP